jgi:uncharacterized protein (DUF2164 family)
MDIKLPKDTEQKLTHSIQRYLGEHLGEDIGELKASLFLKFCLEEIAPSVYNQAIAEAQAYFQERAADLENVCFAQEFGFWNKGAGQAVPRKPHRAR